MGTQFDAGGVTGEPAEEESHRFVGTPAEVPTYFADACIFATGVYATARMQFVETIPGALDSSDPGTKARYVFNLVMPFEGFHSMLQYLLGSLSEESRKALIDGL